MVFSPSSEKTNGVLNSKIDIVLVRLRQTRTRSALKSSKNMTNQTVHYS